jgi:hypothetical protein
VDKERDGKKSCCRIGAMIGLSLIEKKRRRQVWNNTISASSVDRELNSDRRGDSNMSRSKNYLQSTGFFVSDVIVPRVEQFQRKMRKMEYGILKAHIYTVKFNPHVL